MSYILEALKQAQRARDRGQVPRLEQALSMPPPGTGMSPRVRWSILMGVVTALAVTLYVVWHGFIPMPHTVPPAPSPSVSPSSAAAPEPAPRVWVVPAPRADGQPLPRGAEELRQAVLGVPSHPAAPPPHPSAPAPPAAPTMPAAPPAPAAGASIPAELRAEIAAFKRQLGHTPPWPALPEIAHRTEEPLLRRPPPSPGVHWPLFTVNVHVYDDDPAQRFVYLNGARLREGETAPNGIAIERILPEGVWLNYQGEAFFQPR